MQTIVIGHRNPDMDSICSAIGYARLKQLMGVRDVIPARAGNTNERIDYVLEKFGVEAPVFLSDISPRVSDVMAREVISVRADSPVYDAIQLIEEKRLRGLPVIGPDNRFLGLLSAFKISHHLFPPREEISSARVVIASIESIVETFDGKVLTGFLSTEVSEHLLVVGAMSAERFSKRLSRYQGKNVVLLVGDREDVQMRAIEEKVRAIIVTGDLPLVSYVQRAAKEAGVTVISSPYDTATTVLLARGAVKVERMVELDYASFTPDTPLEEAREKAAVSGSFVFPIVNQDGELVGILSKSDFLKTIPRQLILVDHNELTQAIAGAEKVPIVEIIDHHRIGGFSTSSPIHFWNNPVGSTSTIVALCYEQAGIPVPTEIAGLLMAGLISDTLNLSSPTSTPTDSRILRNLAEIAGIEPAALAEEIFSVGSPLLTMTPDQVITADCKEYENLGAKFSVSQIEELTFSHYPEKESDLASALEAHCRNRNLFFAALLVTDINTQSSILLLAGSQKMMGRIDFPARSSKSWELPGVVSRKKQLLPYLVQCLELAMGA